MSYLNQALSRFDEAAALHRAARILELRAASHSNLPAEQIQQRKAIMTIAVHLIRELRDDAIKLGIDEYTHANDSASPPDYQP